MKSCQWSPNAVGNRGCAFIRRAFRAVRRVVKKALPVIAVAAAVFTAGASLAGLAGAAVAKAGLAVPIASGATAGTAIMGVSAKVASIAGSSALWGATTVGGLAKGISMVGTIAGMAQAKSAASAQRAAFAHLQNQEAKKLQHAKAKEEDKRRRNLTNMRGAASTFGAGLFAPRPTLGLAGELG